MELHLTEVVHTIVRNCEPSGELFVVTEENLGEGGRDDFMTTHR